jgi:hypothetical protein
MIVHSTDHLDRGKALLLAQFKGKQNVEALLGAGLAQVQELEDAIYGMLIGRWLPNAVGAQLDILGKIVGQQRGGRSDETYRLWIAARAMVNRSSGLPEQIYDIVRKLVPVGTALWLEETPPAAFSFHVQDPIDEDDGSEIAKIVRQAKAAGVRSLLHWHRSAGVFRFNFGTDLEADTVHGFDYGEFAAVSDGSGVVTWEPV